jgi:hypothetical protein
VKGDTGAGSAELRGFLDIAAASVNTDQHKLHQQKQYFMNMV